MLTDIEIAQQANILPIREIASKLGLTEDDYEPYGKYKAKLTEELFQKLENKQDGKLILVTAINPTPAGEGKTTTTTGLGQAMHKIGKNAVIALREPSLGPVFGVKGGAAGGGYAQVLPMEDINCMQLLLPIIYCVLYWTIIFSKAMYWELMREESM